MSFFWRLTGSAAFEDIEKFANAVEPYVLSVGWFEDKNSDMWTLEATTRQEPDMVFIESIVSAIARKHSLMVPILQLEKIADANWLEETWKNFPPLEIANFYIYGSHSDSEIPAGLIGMEINAATAFGSGEHETTTACLQTLRELYERKIVFQKPLDMGCGSGILAMAMVKLWQVPVVAVDNDLESVKVTVQNAITNNCDNQIKTLCNEGFMGNMVQSHGPYDLITANILAGPLCEMAVDMVANTVTGGTIILSGLLTRQIDEVVAAYNIAGAKLCSVKKVADWAALNLMRIT